MYRFIRLLTGVNKNVTVNVCSLTRNMYFLRKQLLNGMFTNNYNIYSLSLIETERKLKIHNAAYIPEGDTDKAFAAVLQAYNEDRRIYLPNVLSAIETVNLELINKAQVLLLLRCCGHMIPDQTLQARQELCDKLLKKLEESAINLDVEYYNTYLEVSLENKALLNSEEFLSRMKCMPNKETYYLLLECTCEVGYVQEAIKVVTAMKSKMFSADERIFDALVFCHCLKGGLNDVQTVLKTMQAANIPKTSTTHFAIIRGLACRNDLKELLEAFQTYPCVVKENEVLLLLAAIGVNGNFAWIDKILEVTGPIQLSKQNIYQLDRLCLHLIYMGHPKGAIEFYKRFIDITQNDMGTYALFLLIEMLNKSIPPNVLIDIIKDLQDSGRNQFALQKITGVALKKGFFKVAWELLEVFPSLRSHFFWPLLIYSAKGAAEIGVLRTIETMLNWNVQIDMDTLEFYTIPFCDTANPQLLFSRIQNLGFSTKELLSPFLGFLLRQHRILEAQQLCELYDSVSLNPDRLLSHLVKAWHNTTDNKTTILLLKRFSKSVSIPTDFIGHSLIRCLRLCSLPEQHETFLQLLQIMYTEELYISPSASETLTRLMNLPIHQNELHPQIVEMIDKLTNLSVQKNYTAIPHPRYMNITELECHLVELQNKNMEVRGVLRRLIQEYARIGNEKKTNELRMKFVDMGYKETTGMKSALFYTYVMNNKVENALQMYQEIKQSDPSFVIDSFKILDLATMLVRNNLFNAAIGIIKDETKNRKALGGPTILKNCWNLLEAATSGSQAEELFNLLIEKGFCVPSNIILGPLVKIHLKKNNLSKAVEVFTIYGQQYNCTPLQVELLLHLVKAENEEFLQNVLNVITKVHGNEAAHLALIVALAQSGLHKSLRKFLLEIGGIDKSIFAKRCKRWVKEDDLFALETLSTATHRLSKNIVNPLIIHQCIMQIYSIRNDCDSAVKFYEQLVEKKEFVSKQLVDDLLNLVKRCNYKIPVPMFNSIKAYSQ